MEGIRSRTDWEAVSCSLEAVDSELQVDRHTEITCLWYLTWYTYIIWDITYRVLSPCDVCGIPLSPFNGTLISHVIYIHHMGYHVPSTQPMWCGYHMGYHFYHMGWVLGTSYLMCSLYFTWDITDVKWDTTYITWAEYSVRDVPYDICISHKISLPCDILYAYRLAVLNPQPPGYTTQPPSQVAIWFPRSPHSLLGRFNDTPNAIGCTLARRYTIEPPNQCAIWITLIGSFTWFAVDFKSDSADYIHM